MASRVEVQVFTVPGCSCAPPSDPALMAVQRAVLSSFGSSVPVRNVNVLTSEVFNYPQVISAIQNKTHGVPVVAVNGVPCMSGLVGVSRLVQVVRQALVS